MKRLGSFINLSARTLETWKKFGHILELENVLVYVGFCLNLHDSEIFPHNLDLSPVLYFHLSYTPWFGKLVNDVLLRSVFKT